MGKLNFLFFKISLVMMLLMSVQYCFAKDDTTIIIRKDNTSEPIPTHPNAVVSLLLVSATINDAALTIYFESPVGEATITVTSDSSEIIYQEFVDTCINGEIFIPANLWSSGNYTLTISYGRTKLIGEFLME